MTTTPTKPILYEGEGSPIDHYNAKDKQAVAPKKENWGSFTKTKPTPAKRKVLFSRMYNAQWTTMVNGREMPDLARLSDFLQSDKSPVKKPLRKLDDLEIEKIITAFSGIVSHKFK
jgi:hypothetical protein